MSEAVAVETHVPHATHAEATLEPAESPLTPDSLGKLGMWVFLAADAMTFGAAIAAYAALRVGNVNWPVPSTILGIPTTAIMTFILIVSSVTMVEALSGLKHGDATKVKRFLLATIFGGLCFLAMQAREWTHLLVTEGLSIRTSLFSATFFLLTGFHGCHVIGGVTYNTVMLLRASAGKLRYRILEIAGLYWHFVDLVWILIFTFVYLI